MALEHAILATLLDGEASGYDLAKAFDASVANFWMATPQQLYRELERLERDRLVSARLVEQDRKPNKRVFSITARGRTALADFTRVGAARPAAIRDDLLVRTYAVDAGDAAGVRSALVDRLAFATAKLERYRRGRAHLLGDLSEEEFLSTTDRVGPYLTLLGGIAFEEGSVRWCRLAIAALDRRDDPSRLER